MAIFGTRTHLGFKRWTRKQYESPISLLDAQLLGAKKDFTVPIKETDRLVEKRTFAAALDTLRTRLRHVRLCFSARGYEFRKRQLEQAILQAQQQLAELEDIKSNGQTHLDYLNELYLLLESRLVSIWQYEKDLGLKPSKDGKLSVEKQTKNKTSVDLLEEQKVQSATQLAKVMGISYEAAYKAISV